MRAMAAVLVILGSAAVSRAEETREWDVRGLAIEGPEERAPGIGFRPGEASQGERRETSDEDITEWLRGTVNANGWDNGTNRLECNAGVLVATAGVDDLAEIDRIIADLKSKAARTVELEIEVMEVDSADAAGLVPGALEDAAAEKLRTTPSARLVTRVVARSRAGEYGQASSLRRRTYVADYDIEIAQQAAAADPVLATLAEGSLLEFRPHLSCNGGTVTLEVLLQTARLADMPAFALPPSSGGRLSLPRMECSELRSAFGAVPGKTLLVAATDFRPGAAGRVTLVLARARIDGAALKPAEPGPSGDVFRSWNISALLSLPTVGVHPPHLGLPRHDDAAVASDPCPVCSGERLFGYDAIIDWAKAQVQDSVWDETGRSVSILGDQLVVHAPPEVQDTIGRALAGAESLSGANVALESWLVAFPESEWLARRDVIERPKGIPEALFDDLLQLPAKGSARVVAFSSALGFTGSPFYTLRGRHSAFVADHDIEIAEGAKAWDPVVDSVNDGFLLNAGVLPAAEGLLRVGLESGLAEASLDGSLETGAAAGGTVQNPACDTLPLSCDVQVTDGRAFVAATAVREGAKGREVWVYLVRARTLGEK